ncbi:MAG: DNA-binding protein Alba [Nitrososphaerota archaeon]
MSSETSTILIGKKPVLSYVLAAMTAFQNNNKTVVLKARGRAISRAVDVAQVLINRFLTTAKVSKIEIGTEKLQNKETGTTSNVSTIEIHVSA